MAAKLVRSMHPPMAHPMRTTFPTLKHFFLPISLFLSVGLKNRRVLLFYWKLLQEIDGLFWIDLQLIRGTTAK
jgi:hypothetical protein